MSFFYKKLCILIILLSAVSPTKTATLSLGAMFRITKFVATKTLQSGLSYYVGKRLFKCAFKQVCSTHNFKLMQLRARVYAADLPKHVKKTLLSALNDAHFAQTEQTMAALTQFITISLSIPWKKNLPPQANLKRIENSLNTSIFGMKDAKNAVLDAIFAYNSGMTTKIPPLCLVGPPGVGKTAFALAVAGALGLPSLTVSAAGMSDPEIFFKGANKTYQGASPGFFVTGFTACACKNPVIVIDEIDKAATGNTKGTVQNILLQVFDPLQSNNFMDQYLNMPLDISGPLYITTANSLQDIIDPLKDRMMIIEIPNYSEKERILLANTLLWGAISGSQKISADLKKIIIEAALEKTNDTKSIRDLKKHLTQSIIRWLRTH